MDYLKLQRMQDSACWWQFLLGIVNIGILSHKVPMYIITVPFIFTHDPQFLWFESVNKQYFDDWLASFKQQDDIFSKNIKKIKAQTCKWLKITINSIIKRISFFLNIKPDTFWLLGGQPPFSTHTLLMTKLKHMFIEKKFYGLKVSISNILIIGLLLSNNRMIFFL